MRIHLGSDSILSEKDGEQRVNEASSTQNLWITVGERVCESGKPLILLGNSEERYF